jgi:hypothetical protein
VDLLEVAVVGWQRVRDWPGGLVCSGEVVVRDWDLVVRLGLLREACTGRGKSVVFSL